MHSKGRRPVATVYSPKSAWRRQVGSTLRKHDYEPLEGAVEVVMFFRMPRPKSHYRSGRNAHLLRNDAPKLPKRADVDNLAKAVLDEMHGHAFHDDAQVTALMVRKRYAVQGEDPGVDLRWHSELPNTHSTE